MSNFDLESINSAKRLAEKSETESFLFNQLVQEKREKEERENENHENLKQIAQSTEKSKMTLEKMNQTLEDCNALLIEKNKSLQDSLETIRDILMLINDTESQNGEREKDQLESINALACQISESLDSSKKLDFKDKMADVGVQSFVAAMLQVLKWRGII